MAGLFVLLYLLGNGRETDGRVENRSGDALEVVYLLQDGERRLGVVQANKDLDLLSRIPAGGCTTAPLVARDERGNERARRAAPFCRGDTWVIHRDTQLQGKRVVRYPLEPYRFKGPTTIRIEQGKRDGGACTQAGGATTTEGEEIQEIVVAYDPERCRYEVVSGRPARR